MRKTLTVLSLALTASVLAPVPAAYAHGLIGKRFLPATLTIDDPFVADELSLPTVARFRTLGSKEKPAAWETDIRGELSKRLSPDFGVSLGGALERIEPDNEKSVSGFDNLEVALKYVVYRDPEHETLLSLGLDWDVGGTGNSKKAGAESFDTITPGLFLGRGFGDLPESIELLKPLALTGSFGVSIPTRHANKKVEVEEDGTPRLEREVNGSDVKWGFTVQYSLQYLQSFVRDVGIPKPFSRMIPIVEFAMRTSLDHPKNAGRTFGTINPGVIWFGQYFQVGIEAVVPVNDRTSKNIGVLGQLHFYLDDIWPQVFTWTPFHGTLGPSVTR